MDVGSSGSFLDAAAASIGRLAGAASIEDLEAAAQTEFGRLGLTLAVGALVHRRPGSPQVVEVVFGRVQDAWIAHYNAAGLGAVCPITGSAGPRPLTWTEIKSKPLTAAQNGVFDQLRDFGFTDGHVVVVDGFGSTSAVVSAAGSQVELEDPAIRRLTHLLSLNYGILAMGHWRALHKVLEPTTVRLTERQRDCLQWALEGKSSADIAAILGISQRTVDEHMEKACILLGVRTRMQACAHAARLGLIAL
jgi:DNA-binding CsgD family transcriptional regulator